MQYKNKDDIGFKDLVSFKILLDEMYEEILFSPKEQAVLHNMRNTLGYWQNIFLSDKYNLVWVEGADKEKIALSIARFPEDRDIYFIDYVFVKPEFRGQGIAKEMMSQQMKFAKEKYSLDDDVLRLRSRKLEPIVQKITE